MLQAPEPAVASGSGRWSGLAYFRHCPGHTPSVRINEWQNNRSKVAPADAVAQDSLSDFDGDGGDTEIRGDFKIGWSGILAGSGRFWLSISMNSLLFSCVGTYYISYPISPISFIYLFFGARKCLCIFQVDRTTGYGNIVAGILTALGISELSDNFYAASFSLN